MDPDVLEEAKEKMLATLPEQVASLFGERLTSEYS
jgi:hypothetical protein